MVEINENLTRKVAELARLKLSETEVKTFTVQLADVLGYVDQLAQVSVTRTGGQEVEPMVRAFDPETPFREDTAISREVALQQRNQVLQSAPEVMDDGFRVPPIL